MNRVVTGFDEAGNPVVVHQGQPPTVIYAGRYTTTELWVTDRTPPTAAHTDLSTSDWALEPPLGGTCFRIVEIAPAGADEVAGSGDRNDSGESDTSGDSAGAVDAADAADSGDGANAADSGDGVDAPDAEVDGFQAAHATETLDYVTVLSGQVTLVVGDAEVTLGPGDSVVQQPGVPHDWQNRTPERVIMAGVLLSARA